MITTDKWVLIRIVNSLDEANDLYKVFAFWKDKTWRLNSGIVSIEEDDKYYYFNGTSGSRYQCRKNKYGIIGNYTSVLIGMWTEGSRGEVVMLEEKEALEWIQNNMTHKVTSKTTECPSCKSSWDGGSILDTFIQQREDGYSVWKDKTDQEIEEYIKESYSPPYRWGRQIAITVDDKIKYYQCPDCNKRFSTS